MEKKVRKKEKKLEFRRYAEHQEDLRSQNVNSTRLLTCRIVIGVLIAYGGQAKAPLTKERAWTQKNSRTRSRGWCSIIMS